MKNTLPIGNYGIRLEEFIKKLDQSNIPYKREGSKVFINEERYSATVAALMGYVKDITIEYKNLSDVEIKALKKELSDTCRIKHLHTEENTITYHKYDAKAVFDKDKTTVTFSYGFNTMNKAMYTDPKVLTEQKLRRIDHIFEGVNLILDILDDLL